MKMSNLVIGTLLVLPILAHADQHRDRARDCDERARPVVLGTGIQVEVSYCGAQPNITTTVGTQDPSPDGKVYTIITHVLPSYDEDSAAYVLVYKPSAGWSVPESSLDSMGAIALRQGTLDNSDDSGWVAQEDSKLHQGGQAWLPARQIVMRKASGGQRVDYRIIRDTRHNLLYVLYQRDDESGAGRGNRFFDSFAVSPEAFTVDPGETAPGAHLPQPYPNP